MALTWKRRYNTEKTKPVADKLKTVYRKDQLNVVLGRVKRVKRWSNETVIEGLQTRFACGGGYERVRELPYVALPSYRTLMNRIQPIHFDTGMFYLDDKRNNDNLLFLFVS